METRSKRTIKRKPTTTVVRPLSPIIDLTANVGKPLPSLIDLTGSFDDGHQAVKTKKSGLVSSKPSTKVKETVPKKIIAKKPALGDATNKRMVPKPTALATVSSAALKVENHVSNAVAFGNTVRRRLTLSPHRTRNAEKRKSYRTYLELQEFENAIDVVCNKEEFECGICFTNIEPFDGIVLRNCLHNFCKDCIVQLINLSEHVDVKCPFTSNDFQCDEALQDREIRGLLSPEQFEQYLKKSINFAEQNTTNSFHCKLPNCHGWCECDENVNRFNCPVCGSENCINCGVSLIFSNEFSSIKSFL